MSTRVIRNFYIMDTVGRYVAYYGGFPHHRQIPLYFAMQLFAEFVLGRVVDYHDRRPGAGLGVGHLQDQDRRPGELAQPPPHSRRRCTYPTLVPLSDIHSVGMEFGVNLRAATMSLQHLVQTFRPSVAYRVHTKPYFFKSSYLILILVVSFQFLWFLLTRPYSRHYGHRAFTSIGPSCGCTATATTYE